MNVFKTIIASFYSPVVYREARAPQQGMKLLYSLLVVVLTTAAITLAGIQFVHQHVMAGDATNRPMLDTLAMSFAEQVPVMVLSNGTLQVKAEQPYTIYFDGSVVNLPSIKKTPLITIDTTGKTTVHTMSTPILVTAHEIYTKNNNKTEVHTFDDVGKKSAPPLIINRAMATDGAQRILDWTHKNAWKIYLAMGVPFWLVFVIIAYILRIIMLMALGLVALVAGKLWKPEITFATGVQIAAVAYTPVAVLETARLCLTAHSPSTLTLFALGALMVCVGVVVSRDS